MKNGTFIAALLLVSAGIGSVALAAEEHEAKVLGSIAIHGEGLAAFPKLAKITSSKAAQIAVQKTGGEVLSVGLENEDGFLVYATEIVGGKSGRSEVLVDAGDGKVLSMMVKSGAAKKNDSEESEDGDED